MPVISEMRCRGRDREHAGVSKLSPLFGQKTSFEKWLIYGILKGRKAHQVVRSEPKRAAFSDKNRKIYILGPPNPRRLQGDRSG